MPQGVPVWTAERRQKLAELYDGGASYEQIAETMEKEIGDGTKILPDSLRKVVSVLRSKGLVTRRDRGATRFKGDQAEAKKKKAKASKKKIARAGGQPWTEEQQKRLFELVANKVTIPDAVDILNHEFGTKRTAKATYVYLVTARKKLREKEKAAARAAKKTSKSTELVVAAPTTSIAIAPKRTGLAVVSEGRAITLDFPEGTVRVLMHGKLPQNVVASVANLIAESVVR